MLKFIKDIFKDTTTGLYCLIRVILSASLLLTITYFSFTYLSKVFVNDEVYNGYNFHNLPEDSIDIVVLGSSHAQYSYVPAYMYQETGLYSYLLGSPCQPYKISYEMLKEALKTQSPELVIMEAFTATPLAETCAGDGCYVMAAYQMTGEEKFNVINMLPKEKAETYHNDFINNHNNWKEMESIDDFKIKKESSYTYNLGFEHNQFEYAENYWYSTKYKDSELEVTLDYEDVEALNNIKKLCDSKGIQFMLYMVPMDSISEEDQAYRYKIWDWANSNGVKYQDYIDMDEEVDYRMCVHSDGSHSYLNGAAWITNRLANFVSDNFEFNSHSYNEELEYKNTKFSTDYSYLLYTTEQNPAIYLKELKNYKGLKMIRYVPGQEMSEEVINDINAFGLDGFDENMSYYAIINDNKVISEGYDYAYCQIDGIDYLVQEDQIVKGNEQISYKGFLNIAVFNTDKSLNVVKNVQKVKPDWWNSYKDYWEYGYTMYYTKIENGQ